MVFITDQKGLQYISNRIHQLTYTLHRELTALGILQTNSTFFDTLNVVVSD